jgi:hypothetical protein
LGIWRTVGSTVGITRPGVHDASLLEQHGSQLGSQQNRLLNSRCKKQPRL